MSRAKVRLMGPPAAVAEIVETLRGCGRIVLTDPHGPLPTREGNRGGRWVRVFFTASITNRIDCEVSL